MKPLSIGHKSYLTKLVQESPYVDNRTVFNTAIQYGKEWNASPLEIYNWLSYKLGFVTLNEDGWQHLCNKFAEADAYARKAKLSNLLPKLPDPKDEDQVDKFYTEKKLEEEIDKAYREQAQKTQFHSFNPTAQAFINGKEVPSTVTYLDVKTDSKKSRDKDRKILELQQENKILREENKTSLHAENLLDVIKEQIKISCLPFDPLPKEPIRPVNKGIIDEALVMHISDEHADQIVRPGHVQNLENYNLNVALRRAENYVERMLDFTQNTLVNYNFHTLWMLHYGDHVNGWIHGGTENSTLRNDFANAIAVGQMHALMLRDLAAHFDEIKVIYIPGNHGRQTLHKDFHQPLRNLDYLVAETNYAHSKHLVDSGKVDFAVPDAYSVNVDIEGYTFNITHGDSVKGWNGIPWYGIERRNRRLQAIHAANNTQIHYKVMGHFHQLGSAQDSTGETLLNGSWKATDEYLLEECGGCVTPMQLIHGVHPKYGVSWRLPIHLRSEDDTEGPKRYKLEFAAKQMEEILKGK